jgi:hypothetical protein
MTADSNKIDSYNGDVESDTGDPFVFSKSNKYTQIFVIGLLVGCTLFGIYLMGMGTIAMFSQPIPVINGTLDNSLCYNNSYYASDKRNELLIYNCNILNANYVWIGSPEEYQAWNDAKLMDGKTHFFQSKDNIFDQSEIKYTSIMRYYGKYETLQDQFSGYPTKLIIVIDHDKHNATTYNAIIKGNQSNPIFTITKIPTEFVQSDKNTYYHQYT